MKHIILSILATLSLAGATAHAADTLPVDITANPLVSASLVLAIDFWHFQDPQLAPGCTPERVVVQPMIDGLWTNLDGASYIVPAAEIDMETAINGCVIEVAPATWAGKTASPQDRSLELCQLISYEYGHTLGLLDGADSETFNQQWGDPLCIRDYAPPSKMWRIILRKQVVTSWLSNFYDRNTQSTD